jgi:Skp family chaperone for outer membrane proteins
MKNARWRTCLALQICFLNGHLRQARAENVCLKNVNRLQHDHAQQAADQLQRAFDLQQEKLTAAVQMRRDLEQTLRSTIATSTSAAASAARQLVQKDRCIVDLQLSCKNKVQALNRKLQQSQLLVQKQRQENEALRLCLAAVASEVLGGPEANPRAMEQVCYC